MNDNGKNNMWFMLSLISQLTLSFLTPIFIMLFAGMWLKSKLGIPDMLILGFMIFGLASGILSVYKLMKRADILQQNNDEGGGK